MNNVQDTINCGNHVSKCLYFLYFKAQYWRKPCFQLYFMDITVNSHCKTCFNDNLCSKGVILYDVCPIMGSPRWLTIFKLQLWLLCPWLTTAVVWRSFGYHPFGVYWWKPVFWAQDGVQMMQRKETYLTFRTANAFWQWFTYEQKFNSRFVAIGEGYPVM